MAEAAVPSVLNSLIRQYQLPDVEYDKAPTKTYLDKISNIPFSQWRLLPPPLEIDSSVVDTIDHDITDERVRRREFFNQWKQSKGSDATYRKLISALLDIGCREEAEKVCRLLWECISTHVYSMRPVYGYLGKGSPYYSDEAYVKRTTRSSFTASWSVDVQMDLRQQLQRAIKELLNNYASFVSRLCTSVKNRGVTPDELRSFLLSFPAFKPDHKNRDFIRLSGIKAELEKADTINRIVDTLSADYASFINCDVFKSIVDMFGAEKDHNKWQSYSERRQLFIEMNKLSEFIEINPTFGRPAKHTEKLILDFDIDYACRVVKVLQYRKGVADIFGLMEHTLRLYNVEEGDGFMIVTLLIPALVAETLFVSFTAEQVEEFRALLILRLKYCDFSFDFREKVTVVAGEVEGKGEGHAASQDS